MAKIRNNQQHTIKVCQNIIDPVHKIEIDLVGAGGTGSQVLQGLARMNEALEKLGHYGFHVTVYDHDIVEEANIGRQLFSVNDLGQNKAACLVSKINRFYGYGWDFIPKKYDYKNIPPLIITCVDNLKARKFVYENFKKMLRSDYYMEYEQRQHYWLDFGNGANEGQVILGSSPDKEGNYLLSVGDIGLPEHDDPDVPSCSLAEALTKQDLMINPMIANAGLSILWKMFRTLKVEYNTVFLNLEKMKMVSTLNYNKIHDESKVSKRSRK